MFVASPDYHLQCVDVVIRFFTLCFENYAMMSHLSNPLGGPPSITHIRRQSVFWE